MDADAARWSTGGDWAIDEQIDSALLRVRRDDETRWFAVVDSDAVGEAESTVWPSVRGASVDGRAGLLVPRCEGGLLEDALRLRGGMSAALALGVLDEVLEVLETAPAAPCGGSRAAIRSFAVERGGGVVLVPGRFRDGATRSDAAELGELLHLALTGATWEETGLPVSETAPEAPAAVSGLVTDLLEGSVLTGGATVPADIADLRARIGRLGPSRERGFLPAEPGVLEDDAPTGTLSPELVEALRTSPTRSARRASRTRSGLDCPVHACPIGRLRGDGRPGVVGRLRVIGRPECRRRTVTRPDHGATGDGPSGAGGMGASRQASSSCVRRRSPWARCSWAQVPDRTLATRRRGARRRSPLRPLRSLRPTRLTRHPLRRSLPCSLRCRPRLPLRPRRSARMQPAPSTPQSHSRVPARRLSRTATRTHWPR